MPRMMSGRVRLSASLAPRRSCEWLAKRSPRKSCSLSSWRWMTVPIAPSSTRIRSRIRSCSCFSTLIPPSSVGRARTLAIVNDELSPPLTSLLAAWRGRVAADKDQVERAREEPDPTDFYAPVATRFRMDPRRTDDATLNVLLALAKREDVWLDIGSGGGRYALPLAQHVREVVAVDPSPAMLALLREDATALGI